MKPGVAFIAISLHPEDDNLHVSTLSGHRVARNEVQESTFSDLNSYNERGLEATATIIGKLILGTLQLANPEKFKQYPNLLMDIPKGPVLDQVAQSEKKPRQPDEEDGY